MQKAFEHSCKHCLYAALAACLAPGSGAAARELASVDALMAAPPRASSLGKNGVALPAEVQQITRDSRLGSPVFVKLVPQGVSTVGDGKQAPAIDPTRAARDVFKRLAPLYGVSASDIDAASVQVQREALASGARLVRLTSQREGIPVFREQATVLLDARQQALSVGGSIGSTQLAGGASKSAASSALSPAAAAQKALSDFDFAADAHAQLTERAQAADAGGYRWLELPSTVKGAGGAVLEDAIRYRPTWFRMPQGLLAAYYLELRVLEGGVHSAYAYVIDSSSGALLFRSSMVAHDAGAAAYTYGVWADPQTGVPLRGPQGMGLSPYPGGGPSGFAPAMVAPAKITLASAAFSRADPWVDSGINTQLGFTAGNNVRAFADVVRPDGDSGSPLAGRVFCEPNASRVEADFHACTADRSFVYGYDFSAGPLANLAQASSSVVNIFYVLNWLHDWFYDAGFDEASGNAQTRNFGRGGAENDAISARALDYIGFNNSAMNTPADGASPILRSYMYTRSAPMRSGALDNTIVVHEWAHYLSNRLIGNATGLSTRQAAALGEGWSDFVAQLVTVTGEDRLRPGNDRFQGAYAHGAYANGAVMPPVVDGDNTSYFGSRRYPYSTDMGRNPLSFRHIQDGEPLPGTAPINPALAGNGVPNSELHNAGEVWASMLWECYAGMLNTQPFAQAQQRMKSYLVAGMKLTPVNPTLLNARDALLAVMAANDPQDYAACLTGFARRGAGLGAQGPDTYSIDNRGVVESFDAGPMLAVETLELSMGDPAASSCDGDAILDNGETARLLVRVVNRGNVAVSGAALRLQADDPHVLFPAGTEQAIDGALQPGQGRDLSVPVSLAGLTGHARSTLGVGIAMPVAPDGDQGSGLGRSLQVWLNADIHPHGTFLDTADFAGSGMEPGNPAWAVASDATGRWYQARVPASPGTAALYSPWLNVDPQSDFVLTFDQQYDFGLDDSNGGQLTIAEAQKTEVALAGDVVPYTGTIWLSRDNVPNANPLGGQPAFVRRSGDWRRNVTVDLGRQYAGRTVRIGWRMGTSDRAEGVASQYWKVDNVRFAGLLDKPFATIEANAKTCAGPALIAEVDGDAPGAEDGRAASLAEANNAMAAQPVRQWDSGIAERSPAAIPSGVVALAAPVASTYNAQEGGVFRPQAIPTLSQWGLVALASLLGLLGAWGLRRQA